SAHAEKPSMPAPAPSAPAAGAVGAPAAKPTEAAAPAPAPAAPDSAQIEASYAAAVRQRIELEKVYPTSREARIQSPSGRVTAWFVLSRGGAVVDAGVEQSAGAILDRQALVTIRRGRYAPFPAEAWRGESQHRFNVELDFHPG